MSVLYLHAPPLPHYILSGHLTFQPGTKHLNRRGIGVFDLIVVTNGCLYLGEEDRRFEVSAGCALILRPDRHHYPTEGCRVETDHFWLHFGTMGCWESSEDIHQIPQTQTTDDIAFTMQTFTLALPQFIRLHQPTAVYDLLVQMNGHDARINENRTRWKRQLLFQQLLDVLSSNLDTQDTAPGANVADQAAAYMRLHYREDITAQSLGEVLRFHPVYIARCMQKKFGCSPFEYLLKYRLEQAKLLLVQTDLPVARIAEEVGFHQAAYFSSSFAKLYGISPRGYRYKFSDKRQ